MPGVTAVTTANAQAPVRCFKHHYYHIDQDGNTRGGPYLYTGDSNSQGQSVVWDMAGRFRIISADGSVWGGDTPHTHWLDAKTTHKGIAAVNDTNGWYFIDRFGQEVGHGRYCEVEAHYNGQGRVLLLSGQRAVIDENGQITVNLGQSEIVAKSELVKTSQLYWQSFAMKMVMDAKILDNITQKTTDHNSSR
jgi:hypothetical protein